MPKDGSGATIDLNELVKEAATICVDLSEGVRAIHESRVKYCLCRQEYHRFDSHQWLTSQCPFTIRRCIL